MTSDFKNTHPNRLLSSMGEADFERLSPHLEVVEMKNGRILYEPGDTFHTVYFPHDSVVSLVAVMEEGGVSEMATLGREGLVGFFGTPSSNSATGRYMVQVPGTASRTSIDVLRTLYDELPGVRRLVVRYVEALMAQTLQLVACNALHDVESRCSRWILMSQDRVGRSEVALTHEFLAEMLGVQRSTVTVVARTLQSAGLIRYRRGSITITDRPGLEEAACECYDLVRRNFRRILPGVYP